MNNTLIKAMNILKLLASQRDGLTVTEISKALQIPKSSVFDIVHTLEHGGFLAPSSNRPYSFCVGLEAFRIGYSYLNSYNLETVARPVLSQLSRQVNQTVFMAVRSGKGHVVYVQKFISDSELQTTYSVGAVRHMLNTSLGKAILAALPNEQAVDAVTEEMYLDCSVPTIHDSESLVKYLDHTRELGYVIDGTGENSHLVRTVAAPILDVENCVLAAISSVVIAEHSTANQLHELGRKVQAAALEISHKLGYMKDDLYAMGR